ncbi:MAG: DUF5679 domain-containing protein [Candidatus Undinarchaeales archaeon]|nr:DUF5679 domain-containing protein [Candidatus Undinarchaeales archaeon]
MVDYEARCMKCKKPVKVTGGKMSKTKNGRNIAKGPCPNCKTTVCRFMKADA